jgi:hypothetical protein
MFNKMQVTLFQGFYGTEINNLMPFIAYRFDLTSQDDKKTGQG